MSLRGLAILGVIAIVAAVFVWRFDRKPAEPGAAAETVGTLLPADLEAVQALELDRPGETLRVERAADHAWRIVAPFTAEADPREVEALFRAAQDAKIRRVVEEQATDRAPFGLAPAAATLRVEPKNGAGSVALEIGRESPMGGARYVSAGDGRVLLVEGLDPGVADRSAESLRERRLIPLAEGDLQRISLVRPSGPLAIERAESGWRLTSPLQDAADAPTTDGLVRTLTGLAFAKTSIDPGDGSKAAIEVTVETKDGRTLHAELGPENPSGARWAHRSGGPRGVLEAGSLSDLTRDPAEFRDRRVLHAEGEEIRALRIRDGARSIRAWRKDEESPWSVQEEPGGAALPALETKVNDLLDRLRWLRAERFDDGDPAADARVVELEGSAGTLGRIEIDQEPYDAKLLRVRSSWRPGISLSVAADRLGALPQQVSDLTEAAPATP